MDPHHHEDQRWHSHSRSTYKKRPSPSLPAIDDQQYTSPVQLPPWKRRCVDLLSVENTKSNETHEGTGGSAPSLPSIVLQSDICMGRIACGTINLDTNSDRFLPNSIFPVFICGSSICEGLGLPLRNSPEESAPSIGYLDLRTSRLLEPLLHRRLVRVQTLIYCTPDRNGNHKVDSFPVHLNLYASQTSVRQIGEFLTSCRICLQHPVFPVPYIPYQNPHFLTRPGTALTTSTCNNGDPLDLERNNPNTHGNPASTLICMESTHHKGDLNTLLDSASHQPHVFEPISQDSRITTPLLSHQLDAVSFMLQREKCRQFSNINGEATCALWKREFVGNRILYHNTITGKAQSTRPKETLGGLLADDMGLGKTLSILSLVVHSLPVREISRRITVTGPEDDMNAQSAVSATLVVTMKSILPQWEEQVRQHIKHGELRTLTYYGRARGMVGAQFSSHDVVFTTYETVTQEWTQRQSKTDHGQQNLYGVSWFRVVLDEGHSIRNRSTQKAKAINALCTDRRWCVTGTPIHNGLDDMAAILHFLRVEPFDEYDTFRDHIFTPLKRGKPEALQTFRKLIDPLTLRRLKGTVKLPPRVIYTKEVQFREDERRLYQQQLEESKYLLDKVIHNQGELQATSALEIILRLRLICDHGRDLLQGTESAQQRESLMKEAAAELQLPGASTIYTHDASLSFSSHVDLLQATVDHNPHFNHPQLHAPANNVMHNDEADIDMLDASPSPSVHPEEQTDTRKLHPHYNNAQLQIPKIKYTRNDEVDIDMSDASIPSSPVTSGKQTRRPKLQHFQPFPPKPPSYRGPSSKVQSLLDVLQNPQDEWRNKDGPIKSVVFSVWTRMLDLVGIALLDNDIKYCRLDGSMSHTAREASLAQFRSNPDITVILVSLMAGGTGLNLTAASQVHLLEPHWNPMIEEQALDRVHRIGQRNDVQVFRYQVKDSFETSMIELQRRKIGLARLGLEKFSKEELKLQQLKVVLHLDLLIEGCL